MHDLNRTLDRSVRRLLRKRTRYDYVTGASLKEEYIRAQPRSAMGRSDQPTRNRNTTTGEWVQRPSDLHRAERRLFTLHTRNYLRRRAGREPDGQQAARQRGAVGAGEGGGEGDPVGNRAKVGLVLGTHALAQLRGARLVDQDEGVDHVFSTGLERAAGRCHSRAARI